MSVSKHASVLVRVGGCVTRGTVLRGEERARSGVQVRPERGEGVGRGVPRVRIPAGSTARREGAQGGESLQPLGFFYLSPPPLFPSDPSRSLL